MKTLITAAVLLTIGGCANRPSSIPASYVDSTPYEQMTCGQLKVEYIESLKALEEAESSQNSSANLDALTTFLFLVPASALAGDSESDVAECKGTVKAVKSAMYKNECM
jgi:hypothetical protein